MTFGVAISPLGDRNAMERSVHSPIATPVEMLWSGLARPGGDRIRPVPAGDGRSGPETIGTGHLSHDFGCSEYAAAAQL